VSLYGLAQVRILLTGDVGPAGVAQVEECRHVGPRPWHREVLSHKTTDVLGERNPELGRPTASSTVLLRIERDLRSLHDDGATVLSPPKSKPNSAARTPPSVPLGGHNERVVEMPAEAIRQRASGRRFLFGLPRRSLFGAALLGLAARAALVRAREADLRGQVALVTGGSRGLGFLLARELAREGCPVVILARDADELETARAELQRNGAQVLAFPCDVGDPAQVDRAVEEVSARLGPIDVLVNNAGILQVGPVATMRREDFEQAQRAIFWGAVHPTLAVLPQMRRRRHGRIVNVTSIGGVISAPHLVPYSTAKFATVGLSEGLRAELARDGVTVTTIVPGFMRTGSYLRALFKEPQEREFAWFALAANLPIASMDAERAAREIVTALKRGEAERVLTLPALLGARFHGLFPGLTTDILAVVNRFLPRAPERVASDAVPGGGGAPAGMTLGEDVERRARSRLLGVATTLGRSAAERLNQRRLRRPPRQRRTPATPPSTAP
jgi:NAD(P)-dependent dehydrogenase (short-subunit alcohol dehydrogenase family)